MSWTLTNLLLVANGGTQAWGPDAGMRRGTKSADSRLLLADSETWTVDQLAWDYYYGATTHRARFRVIRHAQNVLRHAKASQPRRDEDKAVLEARIAMDTRTLRAVAEDYGVSHQTVSNIRKRHGVRVKALVPGTKVL